ncbi:MAG: triple tyrosine motif-containing protein, partial [Salinimicrobium sp.]
IYLGSNQGLYYKEKEAEGNFKLVPGTTGQVWSINQIDDELYVGHDRGTFVVKYGTANLVWQGLGTWTVKKIGEGIIQGHYNGISYLPKDSPNSNARYLDNFDLSSRNILVENDSIIWVGHFHRGALRLKLSSDYKKVLTVESFETGKSGLGPEIFSYNEQIYCSTQSGIFLYDRKQNRFTPNNELNSITKRQERISGISTVLADGSLWTFGRDNLYYLFRDPFEQKLIERKVPLPLENRNITNGFENISLLEKDQYLVGSNVGYIQFSLPIEDQEVEQFAIRSIAASSKGESYVHRLLNTEELQLKNKVNNLLFYFSVPDYQSLNLTEYSYRLVNFSPFWSKWDEYGTAEFENLPPGSYTFEVKARNNGMETEVLRYSFLIMEPWYYSNLAIAGYILLFLLGFLLVHYIYRRRHLKILEQRERNLKMKALEAEQKVIKLQKEHLERDMAEKNGQLAASTMSLIKKNEFLSNLKEELKTAENAKVKGVIRTIDNEIKEEDNWKMFKEAFKNADKEFFDKIKSKHPNLSSNDLRLCAYLRLNLSSKEIAPLINISVKSVEIKRYRLRKKMELPRNINLTDYIMGL